MIFGLRWMGQDIVAAQSWGRLSENHRRRATGLGNDQCSPQPTIEKRGVDFLPRCIRVKVINDDQDAKALTVHQCVGQKIELAP
jgi:hypothetical protein